MKTMKPRKLRIQGLNSFVEEQIIDFEKLTEKGLFGIFGPTGSGKSTILDAITIAMYGEISRGTNEYINSQREDMFVSYEFEIGAAQERCIYIIDRHIKRDKSGTSYTTKSAVLRQIVAGETKVLCDKARDIKSSIISIIGLNCDDFTRSVVLPQGKFSEFLMLRGSDRREMLERIFNLKKYGTDLTKKIREVKKQYQSELDRITGSLDRYNGITEEIYLEKHSKLEKLKEDEISLRQEKEALDREYERLKMLWELQNELNSYNEKLKLLTLTQADMESKRNKLSSAKNALAVKPFIDDIDNTQIKVEKSISELEVLKAALEVLLKNLNETENMYNNAYERKDKELTGLIKKEANLNTVIDMDKDIINLKAEIKELEDKYKAEKNDIKQYEGKLFDFEENRKASKDKLVDIDVELDKVKVLPEYREKIIKAAEAEREYQKLDEDIQRLSSGAAEIEKGICSSSEEFAALDAVHQKVIEKLQTLEALRDTLNKNCPGDSNLLLERQSELKEIDININALQEINKKYNILEGEFKNILSFKDDIELKSNTLSDQLAMQSSIYNDALKKIEEMEGLSTASILAAKLSEGQPCPVCGSIHHPDMASKIDESIILKTKEDRDRAKQKIDELTKLANSIQIELGVYNSKALSKKSEMDELLLKLQDKNVEELEENSSRLSREFKRLKEQIATWDRELKETEEKLIDIKDQKGKNEAKIASTNSELVKDKLQLAQVKQELSKYNEQLCSVSEKYNIYKAETEINNFHNEMKLLNENTRAEDILRKNQAELMNSIKLLEEEVKVLNEKANTKKLGLAKIEENGRVMRADILKRVDARNKYYEKDDPEEYLSEVRKLIKSIQDNEAFLKKKLEEEKQNYLEKTQLQIKEEENLKGLKQLAGEQQTKLSAALVEKGFGKANEAAAAMLQNTDMLVLEREIEAYDNDIKNTKGNISRIESKLNGETIKEDIYLSTIERRKQNASALEDSTKIIAAQENDVKRIRKDLDEVKELLEKEKQSRHLMDILSELDSVTGASKFVEFISTSQLKYIAVEASRRLADITRGRYALELDSNGEFVMRDDYNGGIRRSVNTLSGGETFLTSLSLALALSSHIQLKGKAPLEFFFLDEGFGTLDNELLETVMSSLERLHSDRLCVGIITHVEEIKNRVPVKLIVTPAVPGVGGTKVEIEYS